MNLQNTQGKDNFQLIERKKIVVVVKTKWTFEKYTLINEYLQWELKILKKLLPVLVAGLILCGLEGVGFASLINIKY